MCRGEERRRRQPLSLHRQRGSELVPLEDWKQPPPGGLSQRGVEGGHVDYVGFREDVASDFAGGETEVQCDMTSGLRGRGGGGEGLRGCVGSG